MRSSGSIVKRIHRKTATGLIHKPTSAFSFLYSASATRQLRVRKMEDRGSILMTLCVLQMLLISAVAQQPVEAPAEAPVPPVAAPSTSPPAPPAEPPVATPPPSQAPVALQGFVTNTSFVLTSGNGSFTGRQMKIALTSASGEYTLALVMDGFGIETDVHYCWTEVHNSLGNLTFRENCSPRKIQMCTLSLTEKGDLRLTLESRGAQLVSWRTDTSDEGVTEVKLGDNGVVSLVKADESVVWTSAEDKDMCLEPYNPATGSGLSGFGFSKLLIICTTLLSLAISCCFL